MDIKILVKMYICRFNPLIANLLNFTSWKIYVSACRLRWYEFISGQYGLLEIQWICIEWYQTTTWDQCLRTQHKVEVFIFCFYVLDLQDLHVLVQLLLRESNVELALKRCQPLKGMYQHINMTQHWHWSLAFWDVWLSYRTKVLFEYMTFAENFTTHRLQHINDIWS